MAKKLPIVPVVRDSRLTELPIARLPSIDISDRKLVSAAKAVGLIEIEEEGELLGLNQKSN